MRIQILRLAEETSDGQLMLERAGAEPGAQFRVDRV